jgi:hypothetical protein
MLLVKNCDRFVIQFTIGFYFRGCGDVLKLRASISRCLAEFCLDLEREFSMTGFKLGVIDLMYEFETFEDLVRSPLLLEKSFEFNELIIILLKID